MTNETHFNKEKVTMYEKFIIIHAMKQVSSNLAERLSQFLTVPFNASRC
jgi:hypothetical protein